MWCVWLAKAQIRTLEYTLTLFHLKSCLATVGTIGATCQGRLSSALFGLIKIFDRMLPGELLTMYESVESTEVPMHAECEGNERRLTFIVSQSICKSNSFRSVSNILKGKKCYTINGSCFKSFCFKT